MAIGAFFLVKASQCRVPALERTSLLAYIGLVVIIELFGNPQGYGVGPPSNTWRATIGAIMLVMVAVRLIYHRTADVHVTGLSALTYAPALAFAISIFTNTATWKPLLRQPAPTEPLLWVMLVFVLLSTLTVLVVLPALRVRPSWIVGASIVAGLVLRVVTFVRRPDPGGDMLPLVYEATGRLLSGGDPYATYEMPSALPLTYLPVTLLAYVPARLSGLPLRLTNILVELLLVMVLGWAALPRGDSGVQPHRARRNPGWSFTAAWDHPAFLLWAVAFLLPTSIEFARVTTAPIGWLTIVWMLAAVARRWRSEAVAVGVCIATTPLTSVFLPFVAVIWWKSDRASVLRNCTVALATAAALVLPFLGWNPRTFVEGTILWFNDIDRFPRSMWDLSHVWTRYAGFTGLFWTYGLEWLLRPLQAATVACVALLFTRTYTARSDVVRLGTAAFILFVAFNTVNWPYFYQPALLGTILLSALR